MSGLDRLAQTNRTGIAGRGSVDRRASGATRERGLKRTAAANRKLQRAVGLVRSRFAEPVGRQVWTAEDTEDNFAVLDQRERNCILLFSQEPLGAIDRVKGPVPVGGAVVSALVDPVADGIAVSVDTEIEDVLNDAIEDAFS